MILLSQANATRIPLADESVHCVVTSPPYWGLRDYGLPPVVWGGDAKCEHVWGDRLPQHHPGQVPDNKWTSNPDLAKGQTAGAGNFCQLCGAWRGSLGLEPTPELYVQHIVGIFREVRRVLREDGVCWVVLGDSYAANRGSGAKSVGLKQSTNTGSLLGKLIVPNGLKEKDLVGIPWRVAFALQSDGWYLRSDVIWAKGLSWASHTTTCPHCGEEHEARYSGSCMPESVNGWRWERHKVGGEECPGCDKCSPNDGYVLRKGSWRPTKGHEYVFMLAKGERYFCDREAVTETPAMKPQARRKQRDSDRDKAMRPDKKYLYELRGEPGVECGPSGRNPRTVWAINPKPYAGAHYAVFPPELVEKCLRASTSEAGCCPVCGAQWVRVIMRHDMGWDGSVYGERVVAASGGAKMGGTERSTLGSTHGQLIGRVQSHGFRPTCICSPHSPIPPTVLDPFCGSGTTIAVAQSLGLTAIGFDLSYAYLHDQALERTQLRQWKRWRNGVKAPDTPLDDLPLFSG
jgi:DNA modification methylase